MTFSEFQQLEQTILAQQSTPHNQQQQLQARVQQILQQKQQLQQQQIKQFQQQVEQQLAYTQHASPQLLAPPPLPPPITAAAARGEKSKQLGDSCDPAEMTCSYNVTEDGSSITTVPASDLRRVVCSRFSIL